ncbi:hypothetical protein CVT24_007382 [Panaeolus cyanescens]|uniref:DUF6534 domain-containing protein n=1 Tax=Panaeolus cyanescens TaxID=181874 RepID=A0A409YMC4_9AGAR|nr:hypothetical protein CVT24_007382 [Panaeolus cyanescens]
MVSASVFQCFMVTRYFRLSGNWILSFIIFLLIGTSFGSTVHLLSIYQTVIPALFSEQAASFYSARFIVLVLATAMTTDILISAALIWQLHTTEVISPHTKSLIHRISTQTIKTGTIPCLFAMVVLITYLAYKDGSVSVCFAFMLGRVYTLTMLFTLIFRDSLATGNETIPGITFLDVERAGRGQDTMRGNGLVSNGDVEHGGTTMRTMDSTEVGDSPNSKLTHSIHSVRNGSIKEKETQHLNGSLVQDSLLSTGTPESEKKQQGEAPSPSVVSEPAKN